MLAGLSGLEVEFGDAAVAVRRFGQDRTARVERRLVPDVDSAGAAVPGQVGEVDLDSAVGALGTLLEVEHGRRLAASRVRSPPAWWARASVTAIATTVTIRLSLTPGAAFGSRKVWFISAIE